MVDWTSEHLLAACFGELSLSYVFICIRKGRGDALSPSVTSRINSVFYRSAAGLRLHFAGL